MLTDTENLIVARFKDGDFNGSLKISFIDDNAPVDASQIAKAMREMGTWISVHHLSIASPQPHGVEYGEDGRPHGRTLGKCPELSLRLDVWVGTTQMNKK